MGHLRHRHRVLFLSFLAIAGCANMPQVESVKMSSSLHGMVHGGQQPISGASVRVWNVSFVGDGSSAQPLGNPVTTDSDGSFDLSGSYTCPGGYAAVYVVATGGNPGLKSGTNNSAIAEVATLGSCNDLTTQTYIEINELTTIAALFPIAPFTTGYKSVGFNYMTDWPAFDND